MERTDLLSQVALGMLPADMIVSNGTLFNVFTREFISGQSVWIKEGRIAYVGPDPDPPRDDKTHHIDADGMVLLPGLIDAHTHIIYRCGIEAFVEHVLPSGVTTVITETIELGTVLGLEGIESFTKGLVGQPIRFYYTASPLCGLTTVEEARAPANERLRRLLEDPSCLGAGEIYWGNMLMPGAQGERVRQLAAMALELGKRVEGHTAGATGRKLQAYTSLGVSSCHEPITEEEVVERLRLGYWVMIREGGVRRELPGVQGIFKRAIDFRRLILCTDSMDPEGFLESGYLDASLRSALELGVPPGLAYQMVTINAAEHFRLDHLLGSLSPGKMADLLLIPSPDDFSPRVVICAGEVICEDGRPTVRPRPVSFPDFMFRTVNLPHTSFPPVPNRGKARVMELVTRLVTRERIVDLQDPEDTRDLLLVLAMDRLGSGEAFMGFLKGFGLRRGACGTTMGWDTSDLLIVGSETQSMRTAANRLQELGGGAVYAIGEEIVEEFSAPLGGIISLKPMKTLRDEIRRLEAALRSNGVPWEKPLLSIDTLSTAAIPHLRITHRGYVRLRDRQRLSLEP